MLLQITDAHDHCMRQVTLALELHESCTVLASGVVDSENACDRRNVCVRSDRHEMAKQAGCLALGKLWAYSFQKLLP